MIQQKLASSERINDYGGAHQEKLKLKPNIRFSEFDNTGWVEVKLKDISDRITRKNKNLETTRPLTISAQFGLVDQEEYFDKTVASANLEGYYLLNNGEFAYNRSYSNGYPYGAIKRLDDYDNGAISTLYICFKPKDNINSEFLKEYFETPNWYKELYKIAVEGARNHGLLNIPINDFFETKHRIPKSIEEQKKIGEFLKIINKKITLLEKKKLFAQNYNSYCSNQLFSIETKNETKKLGDIVDYFNSTALEKYFNYEGGYKVISIGNYSVNGKYIDNNTFISKDYAELERYLLKKNDLAMVLNDKTKEGNIIGKTILIDKDDTYIFNQRTARLVPKIDINIEFLHYLINSPLIHKKIFSIAQGGTQIYINKDDLLNIKLPIPNKIKQEKIAVFLKSLDRRNELIDDEINLIRNFKKGLLQKMFV